MFFQVSRTGLKVTSSPRGCLLRCFVCRFDIGKIGLAITASNLLEMELDVISLFRFKRSQDKLAQFGNDQGRRGGFFSKSLPMCAIRLILVHEPQSDAAAIACCCEVHVQAGRNVQVGELRQEMR